MKLECTGEIFSTEGIQKFDCLRADDIYDNQPIIEDIWQHINEARLILAELSGRNANVFYEAGIAQFRADASLKVKFRYSDLCSLNPDSRNNTS